MVRRRQGARCPCGAAEDGAAGSAQATAQVPLVERLLLLCSGWKLMMEVDVFFPIFCWFGKVDVCCCWYECCAILVGGRLLWKRYMLLFEICVYAFCWGHWLLKNREEGSETKG